MQYAVHNGRTASTQQPVAEFCILFLHEGVMFTYAGHAAHVLVAERLNLGILILGQSIEGACQVLALLLCNLQGQTQHEQLPQPANQL